MREGFTEGGPGKKPVKKAVVKKPAAKKTFVKCGKGTKCPAGAGKCTDLAQCKKETFKNNVPSSTPAALNDEDESPGDRIDYASTMELAYDNLQKMLGEGGMKSITAETKKLVAQQKDLMGTLNSMAPVLDTAKETLKNINFDGMGDMAKMLKSMGGK